MRKILFPYWVLFLLVVVTSSACRKLDKFPLKQICRIERMEASSLYPYPVRRYFTYNQHGNPVRVSFDDSPGTGTPFYDFIYNDKQQLIKFLEFSDHSYSYDANGLAYVDTVHVYYAGGSTWVEEKLFYDDEQRIIKTVSKVYDSHDPELIGVEHISEYRYDNNGNLIRSGVVYDNKINPRRTNRIWMFVDRDYSVNNPLPGPTEYNRIGLPLNNISFLGYDATEVSYDCNNPLLLDK